MQVHFILSNFTNVTWATRKMRSYRKQRALRQLLYKHEHVELVMRKPAYRGMHDTVLWNADER